MKESEVRAYENTIEISNNKNELVDIRRQVKGNKIVVYSILGLILFMILMLFVNGMMVHRQTGLDQLDVQVSQ